MHAALFRASVCYTASRRRHNTLRHFHLDCTPTYSRCSSRKHFNLNSRRFKIYFHLNAVTVSFWLASYLFQRKGKTCNIIFSLEIVLVSPVQCEHLYLWPLVFFYLFFVLQTVLRIWDCLFYEGSKILFRVALTLIRHNEALIQQAQSLPDICQTFKQITAGPFVDDCHTFMQVKFNKE